MTDVLDTIERELLVAIRRSNARRRRRRTIGLFGGAVFGLAVAAGGGVATVTDTPIDQLLAGSDGASQTFKLAVGERPVRVTATDAAGGPWTVTLYRSQDDFVTLVALPDARVGRAPAAVGRTAFAIATGLIRGPVLALGPVAAQRGDERSYLLVGEVEAQVRELTIEVDGRTYAAELSARGLRAPVRRPAEEDLLPDGHRVLAQIGDALELRSFVVALPADAIAPGTRTITPIATATLADGTVARQERQPQCVVRACGFRPYELPDRDG